MPSDQLEAVVSELRTMTQAHAKRCGLVRAMEMVGERWVLLIIRSLLASPRSAIELQRNLPPVPIEVLRTRLNQLMHTGIVRRRDGSAAYELTEWAACLRSQA